MHHIPRSHLLTVEGFKLLDALDVWLTKVLQDVDEVAHTSATHGLLLQAAKGRRCKIWSSEICAGLTYWLVDCRKPPIRPRTVLKKMHATSSAPEAMTFWRRMAATTRHAICSHVSPSNS